MVGQPLGGGVKLSRLRAVYTRSVAESSNACARQGLNPGSEACPRVHCNGRNHFEEYPVGPEQRCCVLRAHGGFSLTTGGRYGVVLTVMVPSMISFLALSTAAMTSVIAVNFGFDMARPTPSLSRP